MTQLLEVQVNHTPATVDFDFEQVKQQLQSVVADYDIVVTEDSVKDAKKVAADLNKLKKEINDKLVAHAKDMEEQPKQLRAYAKELGAICDDGRTRIVEQVNQFEEKQKAVAADLLDELHAVLIAEYKVSPEFRRATFDDLIKLTALTKSGSLTKQARDELENRVAKDAAAEQKVKLRHSELENKSYRAGLSSPLTAEYVAPFIDAPDEEYEQRLQSILDREVEREKQAKEKHEAQLREQHEREQAEQQRQHDQELEKAKRQPPEPKSPEEQARIDALPEDDDDNDPAHAGRDEVAPIPTEGDTKIVRVSVRYDLQVKSHVNPNDVRIKIAQKLTQAGYKPDGVEVL
jgi:hypothetical protein